MNANKQLRVDNSRRLHIEYAYGFTLYRPIEDFSVVREPHIRRVTPIDTLTHSYTLVYTDRTE